MDNKEIVLNHFNRIAENEYYLKVLERRENYNNTADSLVLNMLMQKIDPIILDAGCGMGQRAAKYKKALRCKVFGIDFSPKMLEHASKQGLDGVFCSSILDIPFENETIDFITCLFFVFCYLTSERDRINALKEFYRILKPGGLLFLDVIPIIHKGEGSEFKRNLLHILYDKWSFLFKKDLCKGDKIYKVCNNNETISLNYFHAFGENEMLKIIYQSKFIIKDCVTIGYNSGKIQTKKSKGQRLYILKKQ